MSTGQNQIRELKEFITASLWMSPCDEEELMSRDFLNGYWVGNIQRLIMSLEKDAIYYRGDVMYVRKKWAMENLGQYELDFRTKKEKESSGMTDFAKSVLGYK